MLDLNRIRKHADDVRAALARRDPSWSLDAVLAADARRREILTEVEALKKTRNERSREIGRILKSGGDATEIKAEMRRVGETVSALEQELTDVETGLESALLEFPNEPAADVPQGSDEDDNAVLRTWGEPPRFDFEPQAHWDLGPALGILDFERAAKVAGARFAFLTGAGARLERALIQFMLDVHTGEHGYTEVVPPFLVNADALRGTGQLPKFEDDLFRAEPGGYYLVPTAEVPLTNLRADEILDADELPIALTAYTPCFRSEAGSYGKDVRGLIRQHQFNKVELVHVVRPEDSWDALERLTAHAEAILQRLELPYRVVSLCTGDLGFSAAKTHDLEVWLPGQDRYREISSCSNCTDFQARRARIRFRREAGAKPELVHTLNGSGLAVGRTLVAILENYQNADGTVTIPDALVPYMGGVGCIAPAG
jgi:seryl-tRNA synthetase